MHNNEEEIPLSTNVDEIFSVKSRTKKRFQQLMTREKFKHSANDGTVISTNGNQNEAFLDDGEKSNVEQLPPLDTLKPQKHKRRKSRPSRQSISEDIVELADAGAFREPTSETRISGSLEEPQNSQANVDEDVSTARVPEGQLLADDGNILGVVVHSTDRLSLDLLVSHPMVRIHIVNAENGLYLRKMNAERAVSSYYEGNHIDYILPIMTQPFNISQRRSLVPTWEEAVLFNEPFAAFVQEEPSVLILFEVLDFVGPSSSPTHSVMTQKAQKVAKRGGWYRIAWAFLKPYGKNGVLNTGKKVRLQLFRPSNKYSANPSISQVYKWWKKQQRVRYPATLYVTVKPVLSPENVEPALRSMQPLQKECGNVCENSYHDGISNSTSTILRTESPNRKTMAVLTSWSRLGDQACKVPKTKLASFVPSAKKGCFAVKFSRNGRYLACGCSSTEGSFVSLFQIPSCQLFREFRGHQGLIYDLDWSATDRRLLSASADSTVRVYGPIEAGAGQQTVVVLPHPSYLYTASFHPANESLVVTGGYDHAVRIWSIASGEQSLLQELEGHGAPVNSSCWDAGASRLLTADGAGVICIWDCPLLSSEVEHLNWTLVKEIKLNSLKNLSICSISLQKTGRKLLVQTTNGAVATIDLKVEIVVHQMRGACSSKRFSRSCISPCGGLIFGRSDKGSLCVWNAYTGDEIYVYNDLPYRSFVSCVHYHPHEHLVAMCAPEENAPVLLYRHNLNQGSEDAPVALRPPPRDPSIRSSDLDVDSTLRFHKVLKQLDSVLNYHSAVQSSVSSLLTPSHPMYHEKTESNKSRDEDDKNIRNDDEKFSAVISKTGQLEIVSGSDETEKTPDRPARKRRNQLQVHQAQIHVSGTSR